MLLTTKLNHAFQRLRCEGYFAVQDWACCQTCGWAEIDSVIPREKADRAVFYHGQDTERLNGTGKTYLCWRGDGDKICKIFNRCGITTEWDGNENRRILIDSNERH